MAHLHSLRIIHGDLKASNVRFEGDRAVALIDLDTLQHGTLETELGDALRSWCNQATEDELEARLDLAVFEAAMTGYATAMRRGPPLLEAEWRSIVPGWLRITTELASRFLNDALEERYFSWDRRFGSRGEHNLVRARGQVALARAIVDRFDEAEEALAQARAAALE